MPFPPPSTTWTESLAHLLEAAEATGPQGDRMAQDEALRAAVALLLRVKRSGGKIMVVGNGGSAAIASHLQTDLVHSLKVRALVLSEPSVLTAQANDHGYEHAFANQVQLWADPDDLLVAISSSGRSANILNACASARARGASLLTFSGFRTDNPLRALGDLNFHVASCSYGPVESAHAVLIHHLTDLTLATLSGETQA